MSLMVLQGKGKGKLREEEGCTIPTRLQSSGQEQALREEPRVGKLKVGFKTRVSNSDIQEEPNHYRISRQWHSGTQRQVDKAACTQATFSRTTANPMEVYFHVRLVTFF